MEENNYCVYCHTNKVNGKKYIGQTLHQKNPNDRWHNGTHYKGKFREAILKYGWHNFEHVILKSNLTASEANEYEKQCIVDFNTLNPEFGYNQRKAGNTNVRKYKRTAETRQKISLHTSISQHGLIWIHNEFEEKQIKPEYLQEHLDKGYIKGRLFDKVWIHLNDKTKMVKKSDLQTYIENGWFEGRGKRR